MKKILNYIMIIASIGVFYNCEEDNPVEVLNYVSFSGDYSQTGAPNEPIVEQTVDLTVGTATKTVSVYTHNKTGFDRTFNLVVDPDYTSNPANIPPMDPSSYSVPATVTVPANSNVGSFDIQFVETGLSFSLSGFAIFFEETSEINTGPNLFVNALVECPSNFVSLAITFDAYAGETSWEISQGGTVLFSGDDYDDETNFSTTFCLEDGTYDFTIFDSFGDGICCAYGAGSYSLDLGGTNLASGGAFGSSETTTFTLP